MTEHKFRIQSSTNDELLPNEINTRLDETTSTIEFEVDSIDARIIPKKRSGVQPRHEYIAFEFEGTSTQADTLQTELETTILYDVPWYVIYYSNTLNADGDFTNWTEKTRYGDVPSSF